MEKAIQNQMSADFLRIPLNESSEALALTSIKSQNEWDREFGASLLFHFKSDANRKILTALLSDPYQETQFEEEKWGQPRRQKIVYPVREAAQKVLTAWDAPTPPTTTPAPKSSQ